MKKLIFLMFFLLIACDGCFESKPKPEYIHNIKVEIQYENGETTILTPKWKTKWSDNNVYVKIAIENPNGKPYGIPVFVLTAGGNGNNREKHTVLATSVRSYKVLEHLVEIKRKKPKLESQTEIDSWDW